MAPRSSVQFMPFHGFACNLGTADVFPYGLRLQPHFPIIYVYIYLYTHTYIYIHIYTYIVLAMGMGFYLLYHFKSLPIYCFNYVFQIYL